MLLLPCCCLLLLLLLRYASRVAGFVQKCCLEIWHVSMAHNYLLARLPRVLPVVAFVTLLLYANSIVASADRELIGATTGGHPTFAESAAALENGFENFGNLLRNGSVHELAGEDVPMDHCLSDGCRLDAWSLTVVVPFFKRMSRFEEVTNAIVASTARIDRIIFVLNGSPLEREILGKVAEFKRHESVVGRSIVVDTIVSSLEIGFYFRFMVAQVLDTSFVAFVDDDQIVGPDFFEICLQSMHIQKFFGLCGVRGGTYIVGSPAWHSAWKDRKQGHNFIDYAATWGPGASLDSLWSVMVMPASWVKLVFRERLWTSKTSEDFTIPYLVRKYAGVNSNSVSTESDIHDIFGYTTEIYREDNRSWDGLVPVPLGIHESKRHGLIDKNDRAHNYLRYEVLEHLRQRGEFLKWAASAPSRQRTLVVIGSKIQARFVASKLPHILQGQSGGKIGSCELGVVWQHCSPNVVAADYAIAIVADNSLDDGTASAEDAILSILGIDMRDELNYHSTSIYRYLNGWDYPRAPAPTFTFSDLLLNLGAAMRVERAKEVIILAGDGGAEAAAAALVARLCKVPRITVVDTGTCHEGTCGAPDAPKGNGPDPERNGSNSMFTPEFVRQMAGAASETQTDTPEQLHQQKIKAAIDLLRENNYIVRNPERVTDESEL
jgi:hypothetical protein